MTSEIEAIFEVLFFGSGFWLGFLVLSAFALGMSYKFKWSGVIFELVLFFFALEYFDNLAVSSNYMWGAVLCFVEMILIGVRLYVDAK